MASAFKLAQKAEKYISKDPKFTELANIAKAKLTFITDPQVQMYISGNIPKARKNGLTLVKRL